MILDCSNHAVQRAYALGEFEKIPEILEEMYSWELRGSSIRAFRGRALLVYADHFFDQKKYEQAVSLWKEGFTIVARYGNSRTNVELFDDLFNNRDENMRQALSRCEADEVQELRRHWSDEGLSEDFPAIMVLCDSVVGDQGNHTP